MRQHLVWLLLSAILWLGNVGFESATDDTVCVRRDEALANAAALLGVAEEDLARALSERTLSAGAALGFSVGFSRSGAVLALLRWVAWAVLTAGGTCCNKECRAVNPLLCSPSSRGSVQSIFASAGAEGLMLQILPRSSNHPGIIEYYCMRGITKKGPWQTD